MSKEAMKLAKAFIEETAKYLPTAYDGAGLHVVKALEEALAKQEQGEPVAWIVHDRVAPDRLTFVEVKQSLQTEVTPLYTTQQQRKPLTDEQLKPFYQNQEWLDGVRFAEDAHNIKE
jgi:hypothetical protein